MRTSVHLIQKMFDQEDQDDSTLKALEIKIQRLKKVNIASDIFNMPTKSNNFKAIKNQMHDVIDFYKDSKNKSFILKATMSRCFNKFVKATLLQFLHELKKILLEVLNIIGILQKHSLRLTIENTHKDNLITLISIIITSQNTYYRYKTYSKTY